MLLGMSLRNKPRKPLFARSILSYSRLRLQGDVQCMVTLVGSTSAIDFSSCSEGGESCIVCMSSESKGVGLAGFVQLGGGGRVGLGNAEWAW